MVQPNPDTGHADDGGATREPGLIRRKAPWAFGTGAGLVGEGVLGYHDSAVGIVLVVGDVVVPTVVILAVVVAVLFGDDGICERTFRLLRWLANRPEPPNPSPSGSL